MRLLMILVIACLMGGCSGCHIPSERSMHKQACKAIKTAPGVPENAKPRPIEDARLSIGKNAAIIDLPYDYVDTGGNTVAASQTIHFKRVARTWTVDRTFPTPTFGKAPAGKTE